MIASDREKLLVDFLKKFHLPLVSDLVLLNQGLTHSSYSFENPEYHDNERLEFLGDAVLGLMASDYLYRQYPRAREGVLSKNKSQMISRGVLGKRAQEMGLGDLVLLGKGEEMHGGRTRPVLLGSTLEAVVGALYLDLGLEPVARFLNSEIFEPALVLSATDEFGDYKSQLQEHVQKYYQTVPEYVILAESGPDHSKEFEVAVIVNGKVLGKGSGPRKKIAENQAAMHGYWALTQNNANV